MKNCPICDGMVEYTTKIITHKYKGHTKEMEQSGHYCTQCNEGFLSPRDLKTTKTQRVDFHREVDNFLTTNELRRIRKKSHLTQKDAATLFGGGIRAFHKYESAEVTQSKPLDILLRLIDKNKISLDDIRAVAI